MIKGLIVHSKRKIGKYIYIQYTMAIPPDKVPAGAILIDKYTLEIKSEKRRV